MTPQSIPAIPRVTLEAYYDSTACTFPQAAPCRSNSGAWLREAPRQRIHPIGIFLLENELSDEGCVEKTGELFESLIICGPDELPVKTGNLLRCFVA